MFDPPSGLDVNDTFDSGIKYTTLPNCDYNELSFLNFQKKTVLRKTNTVEVS